jgi:hypothetical protein
MSVLDQVRELEQDVVARLKELEPLKREYEQLRNVAQRLGIKYSPKSPDADAASQPTTTTHGGSTRTRPTKPTTSTPAQARATRSPNRAQPKKSTSRRRSTPASSRPRAGGSAATTGGNAGAARGRAPKRAGGTRVTSARAGQRRDQVLALVREHPGITIREIGQRLGVDPTGLYRVVTRLTDDGRLRKDGASLHPVDAATAEYVSASDAAGTSPTAPTTAGETAEAAPARAVSGASVSDDSTTDADTE